MNRLAQILLLTALLLLIAQCKTTGVKKPTDDKATDDQVVAVTDPTDKGLPLSEKEMKMRSEFFSAEKDRTELFRFFISSDEFARKQLDDHDKISIKEDPETDRELSAELEKTYDKIDYQAKGMVKIELYPDSGKISRVRFVRPTGLSEMDKIISDDVSRLQFQFADENKIEPTSFEISYFIMLRNRLSREEAMKILKKHVK